MSDPERDNPAQQPPEGTPSFKSDETPVLGISIKKSDDPIPVAEAAEESVFAAFNADDPSIEEIDPETNQPLRVSFVDEAAESDDFEAESPAVEAPSLDTPAAPHPDSQILQQYFLQSFADDDSEEVAPVVQDVKSYDTPLLLEAVPPSDADTEQDIVVAEPSIPESDFEDLTLAEALSQFWRTPLTTLGEIVRVSRIAIEVPEQKKAVRPAYAAVVLPGLRRPHVTARRNTPDAIQLEEEEQSGKRIFVRLALQVLAFILAYIGTVIMLTTEDRTEAGALDKGMPLLVIGFFVWLASEVIYGRGAKPPEPQPVDEAPETSNNTLVTITRFVAFIGAIVLGAVAVRLTTGNLFTTGGVAAWAGSILLGIACVVPAEWSPRNVLASIGRIRLRLNWVVIALVLITVAGGYFRLKDVALVPREMTSDHVEFLRDTHFLLGGTTEVFFASNGGREPMQFYIMAAIAQLPGLGVDFFTLKLLGAIESILLIPVMYWTAKAVIGDRERRLGTLVGVLAAAFVAASYWHVTISRMGERIVLMPMATALLLLFLARALRSQRRGDYIFAGLALGFGLYTYQAFRMSVVVVAVSGIIGFVIYLRRRSDLRRLVQNYFAMGLISFLIFLPLFNFSLENPQHFWLRTTGRLFGDEMTQTTDENGNLIYRDPTVQERLQGFQANLPGLITNIRNALLMYNWRGDVAWIQSFPNAPAFDPVTGGLFVVGLAAWVARIYRRRDLFTWIFALTFFLMLLPSALAIGMPGENPSATRMSGTLPLAFVLVALPLAEIAQSAKRLLGRTGSILVAVFAVGAFVISITTNMTTYFVSYNQMYINSSYPYSAAAVYLKNFGESVTYGNAFIINRPGWWDARAVGIDAGQIDYPNGVGSLADLPAFLESAAQRTDRFQLEVGSDMLFFYAADDASTHRWLLEKFPNGFSQLIQPYQPEDMFYIFRIPALGQEGLERLIEDAADDDLSQVSG